MVHRNIRDAALREWIKEHILVITYGTDYSELPPFLHHLSVAM